MRLRVRASTSEPRPRAKREDAEDRATSLVRDAIEELATPLPDELLDEMEARFGQNLTGVAIHDGPRADAAARELDARAFALGRHLVFATGEFDPASFEGRRLLGHELAHALQSGLAEVPEACVDVSAETRDGTSAPEWLTSAPSSDGEVGHAAPVQVSDLAEEPAREAAALVEREQAVAPASLAEAAGTPVIHRWPMALPVRESAAPLANPLVETMAMDVARVLERDPQHASRRVRQRLARLTDATRAAVVGRVQELLTPAQRERAANALSGAAIGELETAPAEPATEARHAEERTAERRLEDEEVTERRREAERREAERREAIAREREAERPAAQQPPLAAEPAPPPAETPEAAEQAARAEPEQTEAEVATAPPGAEAEEPAPAQGEAQPAPESEATAALPGQAAAEGATGAASAPGETTAATGSVAVDLGPVAEAESAVDGDLAQREEAATLQAEHAEAVVAAVESEEGTTSAGAPTGGATAGVPGAGGRGMGGVGAEVTDVGGVGAGSEGDISEVSGGMAADAGGVGSGAAADVESEPGPAEEAVPADDVTGGGAPPVPPEPEEPEPAAAEPQPTAAEVALAESPVPPTTPEVQSATAEATMQIEAGEGAQDAPAEPDVEAAAAAAGAGGVGLAGGAGGGGVAAAAPVADISDLEGGAPGAEIEGDGVAPEGAEGEGVSVEGAAPEAAGDQAGGDCGPDAPGGGGGGGAIEEQPAEEILDVSGAPPAEAMSTVASLGPAEMGQAIGGVTAAATGEVSQEHATLEAAPPTLERPAGSPQTRSKDAAKRAASAAPASATPADVGDAPPGAPAPKSKVEPLPPTPPAPTTGIAVPHAAGGTQQTASAAEAQALRDSINALPTTDPGLELTAGPAPTVKLQGEADPNRAAEQRRLLDDANATALAGGKIDAAAPLGERDVFPDVPPKTLSAVVPAGGETAAGEPIVVDDEATAIIAKEEFSSDVQTAAQSASGELTTARTDHDTKVADEHTKAKADADKAESDNAAKQEAARTEVATGVRRERKAWRAEQDTAVETAETGADKEQKAGLQTVETERGKADKKAGEHIGAGNDKAAGHRKEAERKARDKKAEAKKESGGVLGWLGSKVSSFFSAVKAAIGDIFAAARKLVRAAIDAAQKLAMEVIDAARKAIVAAIKAVGAALIAIGDVLLAAFPALRDKFRKAITALVDRAVTAVNALADALKAAVQAILNLLAAAIDAYLKFLEAVYLAAIKIVEDAIKGALSAAAAIVKFLGQFAVLAKHIAPNPLGWLRNLGASAVDGIRNHLWTAMKCAVKEWFNSKVQAVLGLGKAILELLRKGGINFKKITKIAFEAIKAALPTMVVALLIEKLISLLVPAASALMLIIDGLRAAYGAMGRIIAAIDAFMAYLLAVRIGNAGKKFATALVAGVVAVIDFISNFLVVRMKGAAAGASGRLAGMASKIGKSLAKVGKAVARVGKAAAKVGKKVVGGAKAVGKTIVKAGKAGVGVARKVGKKIVGGLRKVGKATGKHLTRFPKVRAALARARGMWRNAKARVQRWRRARAQRKKKKLSPDERLRRAVAKVEPKVRALLKRGSSSFWLRIRLRVWKTLHRLSSLAVEAGRIIARVNPKTELPSGRKVSDRRLGVLLMRVLREAEREYERELDREHTDDIKSGIEQFESGGGLRESDPFDIQQIILRRGKPQRPAGAKGKGFVTPLSPGVSARIGLTTPAGQRPVPTRYTVIFGRGLDTYADISARLTKLAAAVKVPAGQLSQYIAARGPELVALERSLIAKGVTKKNREQFMGLVRRTRDLAQVLEPSRRRGAASAAALTGILGEIDPDKFTAARSLDPRSSVVGKTKKGRNMLRKASERAVGGILVQPGASSFQPKFIRARRRRAEREGKPRPSMAEIRRGIQTSGTDPQREALEKRRATRRERWRRVGALFRELIRVTQKNEIYYADDESLTLNALADAVRAWADARLLKTLPDEPALRARLITELKTLLASWNGRLSR